MAEQEQEGRHRTQDNAQRNELFRVLGSTLSALALVGVAGIAAWHGQVAVAILLGLAGLGGALGQDLLKRFGRRREEDE